MISKLVSSEANTAAVVVLSGTIAALVASGPGIPTFGRILSGCLSNPIPRRGSPGGFATQAAQRRAAA